MIPKIIHHIWISDTYLEDQYSRNIEKWKEMHPDYEHMMWTEEDFEDNEFTRYCMKNGHWQFYGDWLRVNVLYKYGGVYIDTDVIPLKRIPDEILDHEFSIVKINSNWLSSWFLGSKKGNPMLKNMIDHYNEPIPENFTQEELEDQFVDGNIFRKHLIEHYGEDKVLTPGLKYSLNDLYKGMYDFTQKGEYSNVVSLDYVIMQLKEKYKVESPDQKIQIYPHYHEGSNLVYFIQPDKGLHWSNYSMTQYVFDSGFCIHTKMEDFIDKLGKLTI